MRRIDPKQAEQEQRSQGVITLMIMVMVIFLIQLWLLNIALEEYMAAHSKLAMPTFLASCFCFALNLFLLRYLYDLDRKHVQPK